MLSEIFAEEERDFTTGNDYYITTTNYTSGNTVVNFYGGGL